MNNILDYRDAYILVKGTIAVPNTAAAGAAVNNTYNTLRDDVQEIDIVMLLYNLIEYSDAFLKTSGSLWQYYRDGPALGPSNDIIDFPDDKNKSNSFKFEQEKTGNGGRKNVEIMVPLKYLSNIQRTLEMPLIDVKLVFS